MKTNELTSPIFAMIEGKFARIDINVIDLGEQDKELQKISAAMPVNLPNVLIVNGQPVNLQSRNGNVIAWTELKRLPIRTIYSVTSDDTAYPIFKKKAEQSPPEHEAEHEFDPAIAGMRLFFTSTMEQMNKIWLWSSSYLVAKAPKRKEIFRPPLPNIFSDAKLCMGNDYSASGPLLLDVFAHSLAHFNSSKWNSDAMEGLSGDSIKALYSFKKDKQQPPPKDWNWWEQSCCHPVNTEFYGDLPLV